MVLLQIRKSTVDKDNAPLLIGKTTVALSNVIKQGGNSIVALINALLH